MLKDADLDQPAAGGTISSIDPSLFTIFAPFSTVPRTFRRYDGDHPIPSGSSAP
jgi:hypothetical protein